MANDAIIETDRLVLRPTHSDDAEEFFALFHDPQVMRYIVGEPTPGSVDEMRRMIADYPDYDRYGFGRWSCIHKESGRFIGFSGLKYLEDFHGEVDLGYRFFPEYWGRGIATEAGLACVRYGFDVLGLNRIIGLAVPENTASIRVLEKCGMSFERRALYDHQEALVYVIEK